MQEVTPTGKSLLEMIYDKGDLKMNVKMKIKKIEEVRKSEEKVRKKIQKEVKKKLKDTRKKEDNLAKENMVQWLRKSKAEGGTPISTPVKKVEDKIEMFEKKKSKEKIEEEYVEKGEKSVQTLKKIFEKTK